MPRFQPFEYMAWAKRVTPGARYPMHVSGLAPPATPLPVTPPDWQDWTAPPAALRDALAGELRAYLGTLDHDALIVSGASEAIFLALAPHTERGSPVIVERPAYAAMERCIQFLGGIPHILERQEQDCWRLDPEHLAHQLAETGARIIAITDPHNPTGTSIDAQTRRAIVEAADRHDALLVVDETFASFRGPHRPPAWAAESDRVLSLGSLTKGWGLSALRTGWVVGHPAVLTPAVQLFDLLGVNPPSATLALARGSLRCAVDLDRRAVACSRQVKDTFAASGWDTGRMVPPDDGIIGFLRLPPHTPSETAASTLRDLDGVQVVPGHFFGHDDHIRIGFDPERTDGAAACRLISDRLTQSGRD